MNIEFNPNFIYCDGGRADAGYQGRARDCVVRAICIALQLDYKQTYKELAKRNGEVMGKRSARNGVSLEVVHQFLKEHGWVWCKAPKLTGRKARCAHMPAGQRVIARQAKHVVAVIDGIPLDTWDCSHKMVYGYWAKA